MKNLLLLVCSLALPLAAAEWKLEDMQVKAASDKHEFAAKELRMHLELSAGKKLPDKGKYLLLVGDAPGKVQLKPGESRWQAEGNTIRFFGEDNRGHGTLFAVYGFLEDKLGIRWPRPGDRYIYAPRRETVTLSADESYQRIPPYHWTGVRTGYWGLRYNNFAPAELRLTAEESAAGEKENRIFRLRMRHGRSGEKISYGHAFVKWVDRFGKTHPEYFGLNPYGTRGVPEHQKKYAKLCLSNPAVIDQIVEDWVKAGKRKYLNICPNDGTPGFCRCSDCMKLDVRLPGENFYAHLTDRYLNFWNRILDRVLAINPNAMAVTYVYTYYRHPPRRERIKYPDHLICGLVPSLMEDSGPLFDAWQKAGMKYCFLRPNDLCYNSGIPRGMEKRIYDKFQQVKRFHIMGTDYDGSPGNRALDLEVYVVSRMIAFPELAFETIAEEYYSTFGAAAPAVRAFYEHRRKLGEAGIRKKAERLKTQKKQLLDDSEIGVLNAADELVTSLQEGRKILELAPADGLTDDAAKRLTDLKLMQDHAILIAEFMAEGRRSMAKKPSRLEAAAQALLQFRIEHKKDFPQNWGTLFGRDEFPFWNQTEYYQKQVAKNSVSVGDPAAGWRSSFDRPSLDGWTKRAGFGSITTAEASFDRYSLEIPPLDQGKTVIWRPHVPVTPGATYKLSFDLKTAGEQSGVSIRLVRNGKTFRTLKNPAGPGYWKTAETTVKIPEGTTDLTFYLNAGKADCKRWVDNIQFIRQK